MSDLDIVKKCLADIGKEDYYDDVKEVFELLSVLRDKINKIDDPEIRIASFFAVLTSLTHNVKIVPGILIGLLETVKFQHLMKDMLSDPLYMKSVVGE